MSTAAALLVYAALLAVAVPRSLASASWPTRSPRLAILLWQACTVSCLAAVTLAGAVTALPADALSHGVAGVLHACAMAVRTAYATPAHALLSALGAAVAVAVPVRLVMCWAASTYATRRKRRKHTAGLALIGRRDERLHATVVDAETPAAYCLPGTGQVVVTSAAVSVLSSTELSAVLAHERAHLRGRHHWVLGAANSFDQAFGWLPLCRIAHSEIGRLVEMAADDAATTAHDGNSVAAALVHMAAGRPPTGALGVGGHSAAERVRRLITPSPPVGSVRRAAVVGLVAAMVVLPGALAAAPALGLINAHYCPPER